MLGRSFKRGFMLLLGLLLFGTAVAAQNNESGSLKVDIPTPIEQVTPLLANCAYDLTGSQSTTVTQVNFYLAPHTTADNIKAVETNIQLYTAPALGQKATVVKTLTPTLAVDPATNAWVGNATFDNLDSFWFVQGFITVVRNDGTVQTTPISLRQMML